MNEKIIKPGVVKRIVEKLNDTRIVIGGNKEFYKSKYHLQYTQEIVDNVLSAFFQVMEEEIENGNAIKFNGYLTIKPKYKESRRARNVYENTEVTIPARYRLNVKGGKRLVDACKRFDEHIKNDNNTEVTKCLDE